MANKRYLKDARTRALKARRKKAKNGTFMQRAQQGQFAQQTPYLLNQLNQMGQPGYTFNHGSNMTSEQAAAQSAQMQGRMDQMNPQGQQQAVPQMPGQNPMAMGIQPPPTAGAFGGQYGFNSAQENPNDKIVAAGKEASGVADIEAAAPKIDPGQVAETVTPELAEAGTEVATGAAGDAAGAAGGGGMSSAGVGLAAKGVEMVGDSIQKNADDRTGKDVAGKALSGVGKGAAMGATIGSIVPGIGTAIGAGVGALAGGIAGFVKGKKSQGEAVGESRTSEREKGEQLINMRRNARTTVGANTGFTTGQSTAGANAYLPAQATSNYATAKYGTFMKYYEGGMKDTKELPGGVQMPIGYGVDKFSGNKHDESGGGSKSGIILEEGGKSKPGIEVEDGELQTDVKTTKGKKEYIVSDFIVNPATGNTLAEDMESEIKSAKSKKQAEQIKQKYVKLNEELKEDGKPEMVKAQEGEFTGGALSDEEANVGQQASVGGGMFGDATSESLEQMKERNSWYDFTDFDPSDTESVKDFQKEYNKRAPEDKQITVDGKYGTQTDSVKLDVPVPPVEGKKAAPIETDRPENELKTAETEVPDMPKMEKPDREEMRDFKQSEEDPSIRMRNPGTMIQALGPAVALRKNFSPQTVATPYEKERILGRVSLNQERARADAATQGANRAIQGAVGGPGAIAAQQANLARAQGAQANISDRESKQNVQIAGQETGINTGVSARNARSFAQTQQFNAAMRKKAADQNIEKDIAAYNQLGKIGTQTIADRNQMKADIFQGQASQVDGEFDRALANYYQGSRIGPPGSKIGINTQGGTTMTQEQIDAYYNAQNQTPTADATTKKGGYIKKRGKIKRRKRRTR